MLPPDMSRMDVFRQFTNPVGLIHPPHSLKPGKHSRCWWFLFSHPVVSDCDPMDCSIAGLPLPLISQSLPNTDVHCISDAIQPSHPLAPSCALNLFPASGTFPMSWLFALDDQNTRALASASVLPMSIQGWFSLELTSLIYLLSKGLSGVCSSTTAWRHQFFGGNSCLPLEKGMATHSSILAWRIPMDRGAWRAAVYGVAKSVMTEHLNTEQHTAGSSTVFSLCLQKRILCWEWTSTSSNLNI